MTISTTNLAFVICQVFLLSIYHLYNDLRNIGYSYESKDAMLEPCLINLDRWGQ